MTLLHPNIRMPNERFTSSPTFWSQTDTFHYI